MQFIVIARDYPDGLERRLAVRQDHIKLGDKLKVEGKQLYGVALLDNDGKMQGSVLIVEYPTRKELDEWLAIEPYVVGKVWEKIEIIHCKVGPSFIK